MAYKRLSEQLQELSNPQRSDALVRAFREAVRTGEIEATELPERFTMPKEFKRRGAEGTYQREAREMLFEPSPKIEKWFEEKNQEYAAAPRRGRVRASVEAIESGELDFKSLAEETRRRMQASYEKGQALGKSRGQRTGTGASKTTRTTKRKTAK
ncbi:hypothetical protein V3W47_02600 [Deinococcus sp. YIM 134068]|uniref:hypothetical protein n=1 Tax=Deinococcus lichenicola TaxID=3118910 RepID=UPI002F95E794